MLKLSTSTSSPTKQGASVFIKQNPLGVPGGMPRKVDGPFGVVNTFGLTTQYFGNFHKHFFLISAPTTDIVLFVSLHTSYIGQDQYAL